MSQRFLWKLILTGALVAWALFSLYPYSDRPFAQYIKEEATAKQTEFQKLVGRAEDRFKLGAAPSEFVALKQLAREEKIDLTQYFPDLTFESTLKNVDRRNSILLDHFLKKSKSPLQLGLDLRGGVAFTLEAVLPDDVKGNNDARKARLEKAVEIVEARVNSLGVAEPVVRAVGENRIEVQLPGLSVRDNPEVLDALKKPARLDFRLVHPQYRHMPQPLPLEMIPPGYEQIAYEDESRSESGSDTSWYVIKRVPEMSGDGIKRAVAHPNDFGQYEIALTFTDKGSKRFAEVTTANVNRGLGIVLDGKLYSAPNINGPITGGNASITSPGGFPKREAETLANALNNPLQDRLEVRTQYEVGPSLAQDAIDSGVRAAVIGTVLVAAFMITYYTVGGLVAVGSLAINILIILGAMATIPATLTLPGLAGIVLTIGMAVDANILIFERMREELALGKSLATANQSGFLKALATIVDAHLVQLIICAVMIGLGSGPIKGFGVTLLVGVLATLFSVLITGHLVMEWLSESGILRKLTMRRLLKDLDVDFVKFGKPAFIGSWLIVLLGVGVVVYKGNKIYGTDFTGGDVVSIEFKEKLDPSKIRELAVAAGIGEVTPTYISPIGGKREILKIETKFDKSAALFEALQKKFPSAELKNIGEDRIGATVGAEIEKNALLAVGISMLAILVYIAFRFEFGFGIGAMFSTLHDILMTIGIFVLSGHQFSAPMVAAILCIAGYSINETVVVFDRIREELKLNPNGTLKDIVNAAIRKVFARTIMTASTTFLAALALFLFGGGVLRDISFTFLVGIVTSTFSAICIAAQVFYWWHKGDRRHVEEHKDIAPKYEWVGASKASR